MAASSQREDAGPLDAQEVEHMRLRALAIAQAARIRELEDALARCTRRGIKLSEVLRYYDDRKAAR
jgi:hypothetical protein